MRKAFPDTRPGTRDRSPVFRRQGAGPSIAAMILLGFELAGPGMAQSAGTPPKNAAQIPPGIEVRIQASPDQATVGDPIRIDLDVALPRGYQLSLPHLGSQVGDFAVLEVFPGPTVPDNTPAGKSGDSQSPGKSALSEIARHRARIVVAVYKTGEATFPSLDLSLRDPGGRETVLSTPPAKIVIQSVLAEKDQNLRDLKKQAEIPEPPRWLLWLALGILALILAAIACWFYRRRPRHAAAPFSGAQLDPLELAEAELRDLLARGLLEKRLIKQFYVAVSDIVKRVLEEGYQIAAVEKTTYEIVDALEAEGAESVPREELDCIVSFLSACDLVKFAKCIPSQAESDEAVKRAYRVLQFCRNRRAALAPPAVADAGGGS